MKAKKPNKSRSFAKPGSSKPSSSKPGSSQSGSSKSRFSAGSPSTNRDQAGDYSAFHSSQSKPTSKNFKLELNKKLRYVIGLHACAEVLKVRPKSISEAFILEDYHRHQDLIALRDHLLKARVTLQERPLSFFENFGGGHRGVAMGVSETPELTWDSLDHDQSQILILDGIEDVTNLGHILRTAWLMGVKAIFVPENRAAHLTPAVCKVASGGAEHVPVESVGQLGELIERLKELQYWVFGLDEIGTQNLYQLNLPNRVAWVIGSEDKGLRKSTEGFCDQLVVIPQVQGGSSYNAGVATAICLGEGYRQLKPF